MALNGEMFPVVWGKSCQGKVLKVERYGSPERLGFFSGGDRIPVQESDAFLEVPLKLRR